MVQGKLANITKVPRIVKCFLKLRISNCSLVLYTSRAASPFFGRFYMILLKNIRNKLKFSFPLDPFLPPRSTLPSILLWSPWPPMALGENQGTLDHHLLLDHRLILDHFRDHLLLLLFTLEERPG